MSSQYIENPNTGRPIKIGGRVYKQLQKNGWFDVDSTSSNDESTDDMFESIDDTVKKKGKKEKKCKDVLYY